MFYDQLIYCPKCPKVVTPKGKVLSSTVLKLIESNWSGCGVDLAKCPVCKAVFQISYKVDEVKEFNLP